MKESLSEYELERLGNIAKNEQHLQSLGLGNGKLCDSPRPKRPKVQRDRGEQDVQNVYRTPAASLLFSRQYA